MINSTDQSGDGNSNTIVLACEIPSRAEPGQTFHVRSPDGRYFEITVPDACSPGETINIVVPAPPPSTFPTSSIPVANALPSATAGGGGGGGGGSDNVSTAGAAAGSAMESIIHIGTPSPPPSVPPSTSTSTSTSSLLGSLSALGSTLTAKAKDVDERFKISDTAISTAKNVDEKYKITEKAKGFDEKYEISKKTVELSQAAMEKGAALGTTVAEKMAQLDEKHSIRQNILGATQHISLMCKEVDEKYAVTPTVTRVVTVGVSSIIAAYNQAQEYNRTHKITERLTSTLLGGIDALNAKIAAINIAASPTNSPTTSTADEAQGRINGGESSDGANGSGSVEQEGKGEGEADSVRV